MSVITAGDNCLSVFAKSALFREFSCCRNQKGFRRHSTGWGIEIEAIGHVVDQYVPTHWADTKVTTTSCQQCYSFAPLEGTTYIGDFKFLENFSAAVCESRHFLWYWVRAFMSDVNIRHTLCQSLIHTLICCHLYPWTAWRGVSRHPYLLSTSPQASRS